MIGLLNGAISLYYYAKIIAQMFLADAEAPETARPMGFRFADGALCAVLVVPLLLFGILWSGVWEMALSVASTMFGGA